MAELVARRAWRRRSDLAARPSGPGVMTPSFSIIGAGVSGCGAGILGSQADEGRTPLRGGGGGQIDLRGGGKVATGQTAHAEGWVVNW